MSFLRQNRAFKIRFYVLYVLTPFRIILIFMIFPLRINSLASYFDVYEISQQLIIYFSI